MLYFTTSLFKENRPNPNKQKNKNKKQKTLSCRRWALTALSLSPGWVWLMTSRESLALLRWETCARKGARLIAHFSRAPLCSWTALHSSHITLCRNSAENTPGTVFGIVCWHSCFLQLYWLNKSGPNPHRPHSMNTTKMSFVVVWPCISSVIA